MKIKYLQNNCIVVIFLKVVLQQQMLLCLLWCSMWWTSFHFIKRFSYFSPDSGPYQKLTFPESLSLARSFRKRSWISSKLLIHCSVHRSSVEEEIYSLFTASFMIRATLTFNTAFQLKTWEFVFNKIQSKHEVQTVGFSMRILHPEF